MENEALSDFCGILAMILFVFANAYYPARLIANQFRPWPRQVAIFFKKYLDLHMYINIVAFVIMTVHAHYSEDRNIFLYASLVVTVWLTIAGILMRNKSFSSDTKKQMRMIHTQQYVIFLWIFMLLIGDMTV